MKIRKISLIISFLFFTVACSGYKGPTPAEHKEAMLMQAALIEQYGELSTPAYKAYLKYLTARLASASPYPEPFRVTVLDTLKPLAYCPGGNLVIISRGLVLSLGSEAELAFVIAHEMAHQYLEHIEEYDINDEFAPKGKEQRRLEYEADEYALGLVALAGYDPRASISGLINAYSMAHIRGGADSHPDVEKRGRKIAMLIKESGWTPPGTIDRRAFQKFRSGLKKG